MDNKRRSFLKGAGLALGAMVLPLKLTVPSAHASTGKKLIVFNMHGGNDGLNLAVPTGISPLTGTDQYDLYANTYRPDIHIPFNDLIFFGTDVSGQDIRLHPAMSALQPYFNHLAVFPATHSAVNNTANRSHFYQMDLYGGGVDDFNPFSPDGKGWIGRYFDTKYPTSAPAGIIGHDFTAGTHGTVRGDTFVLQLSNPTTTSLGAGASVTDDIWETTKALTGAQPGTYAGDYHDKQFILLEEVLPRLESVNFDRDANAVYPAGSIGTNFKRAADMLLDLPELEVVHIDLSGFDTHNNQIDAGSPLTGRQANLLASWAQAFAAFYEDLGIADPALRSNVITTVQTEFGRTINQNGSLGTDHGNASCWMAFGEPVIGGVYGSYPSIDTANLNGGNWLNPTIDYRDIFSEVLGPKHMGLVDGAAPFPNYSGAVNPLTFIV